VAAPFYFDNICNLQPQFMRLFTVEELKELKEGDKIYLKYIKLPPSNKGDNFDGNCEVMVNNDEFLTTNKGIKIDYSEFSNKLAIISEENYAIQVYDPEISGFKIFN